MSYEHGNYDYLMACDIDTCHPEVEGELRWWGRWIVDTTGVDGFRIDAVKHIRSSFFRDWLNHLASTSAGASCSPSASTGPATSASCTATSPPPRA